MGRLCNCMLELRAWFSRLLSGHLCAPGMVLRLLLSRFSHVQLFATPCIAAHQASLSIAGVQPWWIPGIRRGDGIGDQETTA